MTAPLKKYFIQQERLNLPFLKSITSLNLKQAYTTLRDKIRMPVYSRFRLAKLVLMCIYTARSSWD